MKKVLFAIITVMFVVQPIFTLSHTEFLDARLNFMVFVGFFLSFPLFAAAVLAIRRPKKMWIRGPVLAVVVVCSFLSIVPLSCEALEACDIFATGNDPSYVKLHEIHLGHYSYTCFKSNGGATTHFVLDIRKETHFFGLTHYQYLLSVRDAFDAKFYREGRHWYAGIVQGDGAKLYPVVELK